MLTQKWVVTCINALQQILHPYLHHLSNLSQHMQKKKMTRSHTESRLSSKAMAFACWMHTR